MFGRLGDAVMPAVGAACPDAPFVDPLLESRIPDSQSVSRLTHRQHRHMSRLSGRSFLNQLDSFDKSALVNFDKISRDRGPCNDKTV